MKAVPRDPSTITEWQDAVNLAQACLQIHATRVYGLISGGPVINVDRCDELLARGEQRNIRPDPHVVKDIILSGAQS